MPYRFLLDRDVEAIGDAFPDKLLINARFNLGPAEGETDREASFVRKQLDLMNLRRRQQKEQIRKMFEHRGLSI